MASVRLLQRFCYEHFQQDLRGRGRLVVGQQGHGRNCAHVTLTPLHASTPPTVLQVLELGCSEGVNSMLPMKVFLESLSQRLTSDAAEAEGVVAHAAGAGAAGAAKDAAHTAGAKRVAALQTAEGEHEQQLRQGAFSGEAYAHEAPPGRSTPSAPPTPPTHHAPETERGSPVSSKLSGFIQREPLRAELFPPDPQAPKSVPGQEPVGLHEVLVSEPKGEGMAGAGARAETPGGYAAGAGWGAAAPAGAGDIAGAGQSARQGAALSAPATPPREQSGAEELVRPGASTQPGSTVVTGGGGEAGGGSGWVPPQGRTGSSAPTGEGERVREEQGGRVGAAERRFAGVGRRLRVLVAHEDLPENHWESLFQLLADPGHTYLPQVWDAGDAGLGRQGRG